jgi:hypothetical protein
MSVAKEPVCSKASTKLDVSYPMFGYAMLAALKIKTNKMLEIKPKKVLI